MANEKRRQLMQEALDEVLAEDARQELLEYLDADADGVREFQNLQRVHDLLSAPPYERAPRRLAATIMARLAENLKLDENQAAATAPDARRAQQVELSQEIVAVALTLVTVATMPMLVTASWMILYAQADPELLTRVLEQVVGLLLLVVRMMEVLLDKAQQLAETDPQAAIALLALIPATLLAITGYMLSRERDDDE